MLRPLPPETFWTVTCIGRHHQRMLGLALLRGAPGIRTGLEDVAYISRGVHAPSNAALVEMATGLARTLGREVADSGRRRGSCSGLAEAAEILDEAVAVRRGPETREAIHRAAVDLFAQLGYNATSMRALAATAEVQPAAIYHWYPSKEAILIRLQDDFMEQLTARVDAAVAEQDAPGHEARGRGAGARRLPRPPHRARRSSPTARSAHSATSRGGR